jgi:hypothetical protein
MRATLVKVANGAKYLTSGVSGMLHDPPETVCCQCITPQGIDRIFRSDSKLMETLCFGEEMGIRAVAHIRLTVICTHRIER